MAIHWALITVICCIFGMFFHEQVKDLLVRRPHFFPPDFNDDPKYKERDSEIEAIPTAIHSSYEIELNYAEALYRDQMDAFDTLDSKCEFLLKFCASSIGALVAIQRYLDLQMTLMGQIGLIFFGLAVVISILMRSPAVIARPAMPHTVLTEVHEEGWSDRQLRAELAKVYSSAAEGVKVINSWKALQNQRAGLLMIIGITLAAVWLSTADKNNRCDQSSAPFLPSPSTFSPRPCSHDPSPSISSPNLLS